ncbi:MAG: LamG-like jellyroll fold domain-containing protein [Flavobacteriaceae bacterium]
MERKHMEWIAHCVSFDNFDFLISTDGGATFTADSNLPDIYQQSGALIAVTPDNANKILVSFLSRDLSVDKAVPYVYKGTIDGSNNITWEKLMQGDYGSGSSGAMSIGQGYYDFVFEIAPDDEDVVLWGTVPFFKSTDGGITFTRLAGISAGPFTVHPDTQDLKMFPNGEVWLATDGGMNYSSDNFTLVANSRATVKGLIGSNMWGFDQGWNYDVIVGGRYHNGNMAMSDTYVDSKTLRMGGAEAPTGWILHGRPYQGVFSDIGKGKHTNGIPETIDAVAVDGTYPFTKQPNNTVKQRGGFLHHPNYSSIIYLGNGTQFWKSIDMGATWTALYDFGADVHFMEISHKNPNVIYADAYNLGQTNSSNTGIFKSEDGGYTWTKRTNPHNNTRGRLHFVISPYDANTIYACRQYDSHYSTNNVNVYKSIDGGTTWTTWNNGLPTGRHPKMLVIQPTNDNVDLVYLVTSPPDGSGEDAKVYYRKNNGTMQWEDFSNSYPVGSEPIAVLPFYRDSKLRVAGNFGVWESPLAEENFEPPYITPWGGAQEYECGDEIYFDDHSMIDHSDVTSWKWTITPAPQSITDANSRNPIVVLGQDGSYTVTLEVVKNGKTYSKTITDMFTVTGCSKCDVPEELASYQFENDLTNSGSLGADADLSIPEGFTGTPTYTTEGVNGTSAYVFDTNNPLGTDSESGWQGITGNYARTITAWVKLSSFPFNIFNFGYGGYARYTLKVNSSGYLSLDVQGSTVTGTTAVSKNEWVHVAVTMPEGGTLGDNILCVNGDVYATSDSTQELNTRANPVYVGGQANNAGALGPILAKPGQMDVVRVFECALTEAQIEKVMGNILLSAENIINQTKQVKAYPVPTSGLVNISLPNNDETELKYQIISVQGQVVKSGAIKSNFGKQDIDISPLSSGIYIINLTDADGTAYRVKVVKE